MDAKQFMAEFGYIANSQNGVEKLRELILLLATTGRLVANDAEKINIKEIILDAKLAEIKKLNIKKHPITSDVSINKITFQLPDTWAALRLGDLCWSCKTSYGENLSANLITKGVIKVGNISNDGYFKGYFSERGFEEKDVDSMVCRNGDIVVVKSSGSAENVHSGKAALCEEKHDGKIVASNFVLRLRLFSSAISPEFLWRVLSSRYSRGWVEGTVQTMTYPNLKWTDYSSLPLGIPTIAEQNRIVKKVNELMALCDNLEAQQQKRHKLLTLTRTSALGALANAQSPHEIKSAWQRVKGNMPFLFRSGNDVVELKQTLRELAIIGHLSQRADDNVDEYLNELKKKKQGRRTAKAKEVESDITLPKGWRWVLLEDLLHSSDSGWSPKCDPAPRENNEWGVLKVSAVTWGKFKSEENKALPLSLEARPECEVKPYDFMLSRANTAELVAKSVIAPADVSTRLMMSDKIVRLNFIDDELKPWVNLVNNSKLSREYYKSNATGTSDSMRNVSRKVIHELAIPLPPKSEQMKIMEKLIYLESHCDQLEKQINKSSVTVKYFAQAAISTITGFESKNEEAMKIPKTELVSILKLKVSPTNKDQAPLSAILAKHNGELSSKALWNYSGLDIDAFYRQLKTEMARDWIVEPQKARVIEKDAEKPNEAEAG